jgi:hypothetical protein
MICPLQDSMDMDYFFPFLSKSMLTQKKNKGKKYYK